jgi:hypothetical protein
MAIARSAERATGANMTMSVFQSSAAYERWLENFMQPIASDLRLKHLAMRKDEFTFFRATFYRWAQWWETLPKTIRDAPAVLGVGDAHVENFGTWRDREGRLIWGINDFDEAAVLPFTNDLVRVAVSGLLASEQGSVRLAPRDLLAALLWGYSTSLDYGGTPFVIEERNPWLRELAHGSLRTPERFWAKLTAIDAWTGAISRGAGALLHRVPRDAEALKVVHRVSGAGSLGRPRLAAVFAWRGGYIAREIKARAPSAWLWATTPDAKPSKGIVPQVWKHARRCQDPSLTATRRWIARRLAPDCSRISLADLPRKRQEAALFRAMGWEIANIHCGSSNVVAVREHLASLHRNWLSESSEHLLAETRGDFRHWQHSARHSR